MKRLGETVMNPRAANIDKQKTTLGPKVEMNLALAASGAGQRFFEAL